METETEVGSLRDGQMTLQRTNGSSYALPANSCQRSTTMEGNNLALGCIQPQAEIAGIN